MAQWRVAIPDPISCSGHYRKHGEWIKHALYEATCAYCLRSGRALEIEHYVPKGYKPELQSCPYNLLLACGDCNGRGSKHDYHPKNSKRVTRSDDHSGHMVINPVLEDLGAFYNLTATGDLVSTRRDRPRSEWHALMFDLDAFDIGEFRRETLTIVQAADALVTRTQLEPSGLAELELYVGLLAKRWLLLVTLDVPMSATLQTDVRRKRDELRAHQFST